MSTNSMVFLLLVILGGVPLIILVYYGAQLALGLLERAARPQSPGGGRAMAARREPVETNEN